MDLASKHVLIPLYILFSMHIHVTGTVVKHKRGKLLSDLAHPGDEVLVARGGRGGVRLCSFAIDEI